MASSLNPVRSLRPASGSFEKSRSRLASGHDEVQKRTFTKWINSYLSKAGVQVEELYEDLRDGRNLILLVEALTGKKLRKENGSMRLHKLLNLNSVFAALDEAGIETVNISSEDILDGSAKLTLGLVWRLILHFQLSKNTDERMNIGALRAAILRWCRDVTNGYAGTDVTNFTTSWKSGLAFNAIIHHFRPELVDYDSLDKCNPEENLEKAFAVAANDLGIPRLLDVSDLAMDVPDENSLLTYVSFFVKTFTDESPDKQKRKDILIPNTCWQEYANVARPFMDWIQENLVWLQDEAVTTDGDMDKAKEFEKKLSSFHDQEITYQLRKKNQVERLFQAFAIEDANAKRQTPKPGPVEDGLHIDDLCKAWGELWVAYLDRLRHQKEHVAALMKNALPASIMDGVIGRVCNCERQLENLQKRINEFQGQPGEPLHRDDMDSIAACLSDEVHDMENQLRSLNLTAQPSLVAMVTDIAESSTKVDEQLHVLLSLCDKLTEQLIVSVDAISILRDVDVTSYISAETLSNGHVHKDMKIDWAKKLTRCYEEFIRKHGGNVDPHNLKAQLTRAHLHWDLVCTQLQQPVEQLSKWLTDVEERLLAQQAILHCCELVKKLQTEPLRKLADGVHTKEKDYTAVMEKYGLAEKGLLTKLITALHTRWSLIQEELGKMVKHIMRAEQQLEEFEDELYALGNWLAWTESEFVNMSHLTGAKGTDKYEMLLSDVKAHEPYVISTTKKAKLVVVEAEHWQQLLNGFKTQLGKMSANSAESSKKSTNKDIDQAEKGQLLAAEILPEEVNGICKRYTDLLRRLYERLHQPGKLPASLFNSNNGIGQLLFPSSL